MTHHADRSFLKADVPASSGTLFDQITSSLLERRNDLVRSHRAIVLATSFSREQCTVEGLRLVLSPPEAEPPDQILPHFVQ
jgi:hypothetical protein